MEMGRMRRNKEGKAGPGGKQKREREREGVGLVGVGRWPEAQVGKKKEEKKWREKRKENGVFSFD